METILLEKKLLENLNKRKQLLTGLVLSALEICTFPDKVKTENLFYLLEDNSFYNFYIKIEDDWTVKNFLNVLMTKYRQKKEPVSSENLLKGSVFVTEDCSGKILENAEGIHKVLVNLSEGKISYSEEISTFINMNNILSVLKVFFSDLNMPVKDLIKKNNEKASSQEEEIEKNKPENSPVKALSIKDGVKNAWLKILEAENVEDNVPFFEAGGNSLLLHQLKYEIETNTGKKISVVDLMEFTTVSQISDFLEKSE